MGTSSCGQFEALSQIYMAGLTKTMKCFRITTLWTKTWTLEL